MSKITTQERILRDEIGLDGHIDGLYVDCELSKVEAAMDLHAKNQAIAFAEWMDDKGYTIATHAGGARWESLNDFSKKTTEELYGLFLIHQSQQNKQS